MKFYKLYICLMMVCFTPTVWAADLPQALKDGLQRLSVIKGFECHFKQSITYDDASQQKFQGSLKVAKFGHFRWQYTQPYEQLYVSNGEAIWFYEPDLMQVQYLQSLDGIDPIAMRLLEGRVQANEIQLLDIKQEAGKDVYHLRIGSNTELWLSLNERDLPAWFESRDALGNRNRMELVDLNIRNIDMKNFEFTVPKGVDVLNSNGQIVER
ncbi:MAG: outer membrane lipoprotein chaperone LolA [Mariprofundaceae bacterium]|nr:outer membrane lipoprotein chaperone LolA [Mariprofundaceae bacterium]